MVLERRHNLAALYALFDGRCPPRRVPDVAKVELGVSKDSLAEFVRSGMHEVAEKYDGVQKGDPDSIKEKKRALDSESQELHQTFHPQNTAFSFSVAKNYWRVHDDQVHDSGTYPPHHAGEVGESVLFELKNEDKEMGGYRLDRDLNSAEKNSWALNDRLVLDEYREQGVGSALLTASESFVQEYAHIHQTPQKLTANVAQPSVLVMLLNKGYKAATDEDQRRIDMVLTAHADLELDYSVVKREKGWETQRYKDLYCFERGVTLKSEQNAFRINLERVFEPKVSKVDETGAGVRAELDDALPDISPKANRLRKLRKRRERGEISPTNYDLDELLQFMEVYGPLTATELRRNGGQALVMTRAEFDEIGSFDIILPSGARTTIDPESLSPDDIFILYPNDLGG